MSKTDLQKTNVDTDTKTDINVNTNTDTDINTKVESNGGADSALTLTQEQLQEMINKAVQSSTDKVRTEYSKKLKEKEKEVEDVTKSKMSEKELFEYEKEQFEKEKAAKEAELADQVAAFHRSQLELQAIDLLKDSSLPIEAKEFLVGADLDATTANIATFKAMFDAAVEVEIKARIKGTAKEHKETGFTGSMTKEQFAALTYAERNELFVSNPGLYTELSK